MGPQTEETREAIERPWAEREKDRLNAEFAGRWETWFVPVYMPKGYTWCARPAGASASVVRAGTPDELAEKIAAYEETLTDHIAATRTELGETDPSWTGRRAMLLSRLDALRVLQSKGIGPRDTGC